MELAEKLKKGTLSNSTFRFSLLKKSSRSLVLQMFPSIRFGVGETALLDLFTVAKKAGFCSLGEIFLIAPDS